MNRTKWTVTVSDGIDIYEYVIEGTEEASILSVAREAADCLEGNILSSRRIPGLGACSVPGGDCGDAAGDCSGA